MRRCREATFDEGEVVFQMDETATHMYLVISGKIERRLEVRLCWNISDVCRGFCSAADDWTHII